MTAKASGDSTTRSTLEAVRRFNEAFDRHDEEGVMAAMNRFNRRVRKEVSEP